MCWQGLCVVNENSTYVGFTLLLTRGHRPSGSTPAGPQAS